MPNYSIKCGILRSSLTVFQLEVYSGTAPTEILIMAVLYKRIQVVHEVGVKMGGVRVSFRVSY